MAYYSFQSHFLVVKVQENNDIKGFSCTLFCPFGQNELDIKKCDAQILYILGNLRSPNKVRGSNRPKAVTEYTLIISFRPLYCQEAITLQQCLLLTFPLLPVELKINDIKQIKTQISGVQGYSLLYREMSAKLTEGTGDRWEPLAPCRSPEAAPLAK